jgi:hypothetical protein
VPEHDVVGTRRGGSSDAIPGAEGKVQGVVWCGVVWTAVLPLLPDSPSMQFSHAIQPCSSTMQWTRNTAAVCEAHGAELWR